ncbi:MAG TPA: DUF5050 domain-containing protein, partial [Acidobacteriota bacterium]|nr:DUF5050 domain-containing protein [Acidobacteriota bacterium]
RIAPFRWVSDNPGIVTVNDKGLATPVKLGQTRIRAIAADGTKTNDCVVTVSRPSYWGSLNGTDSLVIQNDWVYFANPADGGSLYKVRIDGENLTRLSDDVPQYLNVTGRWIYYLNRNSETGHGLYMISIDGDGRLLLNDKDDIIYLRVHKLGLVFYLTSEGDVFRLYAHMPEQPVRKVFDDKPVYSIAVNDDYIFYNRHWEDFPQPLGAGGVYVYNIRTKKIRRHISVNINTSPIILDQNNNNRIYYCSYGDHMVPIDKGLLSGIFSDSPSTGWFIAMVLNNEGDDDKFRQTNSGASTAGAAAAIPIVASKIKLASGDRIQWGIDGWIYYIRNRELRRMKTDGKQDQNVLTPPVEAHAWYYGGNYLFYWSVDDRLFRTLKDGRNTIEIMVKRQ